MKVKSNLKIYILIILSCLISSQMLLSTADAKNIPKLILHDEEGGPVSASVYTTGIGMMPASDEVSYEKKKLLGRRIAVVDGYKNLLLAIQGAKKYLTQQGEEVFIVEGYLKNIEIIETRYLDNGTVEVDMMVHVKVYDPSIVKDPSIIDFLRGKVSSAVEGIEIIEVDTSRETLQGTEEIYQEIQAADPE